MQEIPGGKDELELAALQVAYAHAGGIARADEIGRLLADHGPRTFISVAQLVADQDVFGFECDGYFWLPMFQFGPTDLAIKPGPRQIRADLGPEFDGRAVSAWFVEPNVWLRDRRPIDLVDSHLPAVLQAARVDRFVATG